MIFSFQLLETLGRVAIVGSKDVPANTNQALAIIRLISPIYPLYIAEVLSSQLLDAIIKRDGRGVGLQNLNLKQVSEFNIPLPPLNEQRRIVSTIEQLTDRSHKARTALEDVPKLIEQFRQSVLAAAFRGDLTADWREKNPDVEPASELLERIKIDRLREAKSSKQVEKINEIYSYQESEDTDALPTRWQYTPLEKLANSIDYGTSAKSSSSGDVVVLRMGNLQGGDIDWGDLAYTSDKDEIAKYRLQPNTVFIQ